MSSSPIQRVQGPSADRLMEGRRDFLVWLTAGRAFTGLGGQAASGSGGGAAAANTARAVTRDALGPYFEVGSPVRTLQIAKPEEPGARLGVEGRLLGPDGHTPLAGYALDLWQCDKDGNYYHGTSTEYRLRGKIRTDAQGRYRFETVLPGRYGDAEGIRPAHIHVRFMSPGDNVILTSQLYFDGDPFLGKQDYATRKGSCDAADPNRYLHLKDGLVDNVPGKTATFDAILPRS